MRDVAKAFSGTRALDDVDLTLRPGRILALAGGNGSGKSTLVKILAGVYAADHGELELGEERFDLTRVTERSEQVHVVHQEPTVFPSLTVAENLSIGRGFETGFLHHIRRRAVASRTRLVLERFGIDARPSTIVADLRPAAQTMIAIARVLQDIADLSTGVLVLDEPTAALPPADADQLLSAMLRYREQGQAIIFISHRLDEVLEVADEVTVLRDGRVVTANVPPNDLGHDGLVELIAGRAISSLVPVSGPPASAPALEVRGLQGGVVRDVSLTVRGGEVLGLAGVAGAGCSSILRLVFGAQRRDAGDVIVADRALPAAGPATAMAAGIAYVPPDRAALGVFPDESVQHNLMAASVSDSRRGVHLDGKRERAAAQADAARFTVRAASLSMPISQLSGGNQQKVILARWLRRSPRLLLLDEPTQGVDVGARADVWNMIHAAVLDGAGALVASSDIEELCSVCNRILVVRDGRIASEIDGLDLSAERVLDALNARHHLV